MEGGVTFQDLLAGFRQLGIERSKPVIAHASLSAFGQVVGGAPTALGALLAVFDSLVMPTFTYKTMLTPLVGPLDNGISYGRDQDRNRMALMFDPGMPADRLMGVIPEALRQHTGAERSLHPILSFAGLNARRALAAQTYTEPLAPIRVLSEAEGWALLIGVNHTVNTSLHYAERLAGRKQFIRWALTKHGARECPGFPGCSDGFEAITTQLGDVTRQVQIGTARVQAIPLRDLVERAASLIKTNRLALLCERDYCERCSSIKNF